MEIKQGDIFWIEQDEPKGSEPGYRRPFVVVQNNLFNQSRISTVVVCALTTNLQRAKSPGNVLLAPGEGGLSKSSVVNVSQLSTVDKHFLEEYCGALSSQKVEQIISGINLLLQPAEVD
ncbi:MAG: type II toxin-antitoxin system PemK/MazF family toxin [Anaerolineaceae bacterium]|nr:type II toxin-antitoxin system PemK/MazF family toxin [Anaerolineaceae bacterium]